MSTSLPVPSPGALRALRNLALGTSCTVAVSAGLLTEDRRRRIHAARAIQQNGQRIKGSKSYHESAGAVAIAALEDHVLSPEYFSSTTERHLLPPAGTWKSQPIHTHFAHETPTAPGHAPVAPVPMIAPPDNSLAGPVLDRRTIAFRQVRRSEIPRDIIKAGNLLADGSFSGLLSSIRLVLKHLRAGDLRHNDDELVQFCGMIYRRCTEFSSIQAYLPLLQEILSSGSVSEETYYALHAPGTATQLLDLRHRPTRTPRDAEFLSTALSIFLKPFHATMHSQPMIILAESLCSETYKTQMWEQTIEVCQKIMTVPGTKPLRWITYLISANRELGNHQQAVRYFRSEFVKVTQRNEELFRMAVVAALDSAMKLRPPRASEDVVTISAEMARAHGFNIRAEWVNMALGKQWRSSTDLAKTRALFEKLEVFANVVDIPESIYSAMMQFCVEDGNEELALRYYEQSTLTENAAVRVRFRTAGHLALMAAMRDDWVAVKEQIKTSLAEAASLTEKRVISKVFAPLFKLYSSKHDVRETESFLREFLDSGLLLHRYTSNLLVDKFASAMEMDSISRWLAEITLHGLQQDSGTFNTILTGLRDEWRMDFEDLFKCMLEMRERDASMVDNVTINILEDALIRKARGDRLFYTRYVKRLEGLRTSGAAPDGLKDDYRIMRAAFAKGSNVKTLRHYEYLMADENSLVSPRMVDLAIRACLNMRGKNSYETAVHMLEAAKERGIDITIGLTRVMLREVDEQIEAGHLSSPAFSKLLYSLIQRDLETGKRVVCHIGNILCDRETPQEALKVWSQFIKNCAMDPKDVNLPCLTLLLRIQLQRRLPNSFGLEYIMRTMSANRIVPDKTFMVLLREGIRNVNLNVLGSQSRGGYGRRDQEYLQVLEAFYHRLKCKRSEHVMKSQAAAAQLLDIMDQAVKDDECTKQQLPEDDVDRQMEGSVPAPTGLEAEATHQGEEDVKVTSFLECPKCHEEKPRADFAKKKGRSGASRGLFDNCRTCRITGNVNEPHSQKSEVIPSQSARGNADTHDQVQSRPHISIIAREKKTAEQIEERRKQTRKRWLDSIHHAQEQLEDRRDEDWRFGEEG